MTGGSAERYFRDTDYWRAWSRVPDLTADVVYALEAVRPSDRRVLDVPCGRGRLVRAVRRRASQAIVVGADVNSAMVTQLRGDGGGAHGVVGTVYVLPFRERYFDVVLCHESLMHFEHPREALEELARVTADRLYFSVTTRRQINTLLRRFGFLGVSDVPHWTYNLSDVRRLFPAGFRWHVTGAFLLGRKVLRLSHAAHVRLDRLLGQRLPQPLLRTFGQTLFVYGSRER